MRSLALAATFVLAVSCFAYNDDAPQVNTLSPKVAKPGDTLEITGVRLDENKVDEVFLTDHKFDMKMKLLKQEATCLKVRVPPFVKPGRMQLLLLTKGDDPKLLEQPLYVLIEENSTQIGQLKKEPEKQK